MPRASARHGAGALIWVIGARTRPRNHRGMTPIVRRLLWLNALAFALELVWPAVVDAGALWPLAHGFRPWQLLTHAFLHGGLGHLATNLFGLWMFGRDVERVLGSRRFLELYLASVLCAAGAQLLATALTHETEPTLGASGGVFGILGAFALLFPRRVILLLFPPIPLPAPLFVALYALFELFAGVSGAQAGVAHFAHLGGLAGGLLALRHWRRQAWA